VWKWKLCDCFIRLSKGRLLYCLCYFVFVFVGNGGVCIILLLMK
jgi:hypothetical protein